MDSMSNQTSSNALGMEIANDATISIRPEQPDPEDQKNAARRTSTRSNGMVLDNLEGPSENHMMMDSLLVESPDPTDQQFDLPHDIEQPVPTPTAEPRPTVDQLYRPFDVTSLNIKDIPDEELPNPYDYAGAPDTHHAQTYMDSPLATPVHETASLPRRLPSVLRPGNPKTFDTTGSRRASMAFFGDYEYVPNPRPNYAVSDFGIRHSYAGDGDTQYVESLFSSWEEPVAVSAPWTFRELTPSPVQPMSELANDQQQHESLPDSHRDAIPERRPSTRPQSMPMGMPVEAWPEKKSRSLRKLSKWKFWSKKSSKKEKKAATMQ